MLKEKDSVVRQATIIFDASVVALAFILAFFLRDAFHSFYKLDFFPSVNVIPDFSASFNDYLQVMFLIISLWILVLSWNGMYRSMRTKTILEALWIILKSAITMTVVFGTVVFLFKLHFISRIFFTVFLVLSSIAITLDKVAIFSIMHYVRKQGYNFRRMLIVGTGRRAVNFMEKVNSHPEWGFRLLGFIDDEERRTGEKIKEAEIIGALGDIPSLLKRHSVDEVVFIVPRSMLNNIENAVYACESAGVKATLALDLFDLKIAKSRQTELEGIPLITFETTPSKEWQLFLKRALDILVSGLGIALLSPFLLAVAILIKLTSSGPVFFLQKRIGLNGRKFILYKFRTMYKGAQRQLLRLLSQNEMKGPVFKIKNDPRITPLGRLLRKFSIDEIPQLFNVFLGKMSLVGPRPPIPKEVLKYDYWQRRRLSMRPGVTCLWQISGRNKKIDFDEWVKLDLEYIDNWSLWFDFKIFFKTIPVVLFGIGAY